MATFKIPSFKFGLDTRREQLTSNAGTLLTASNVVVNEGGELAKRGKFFEASNLAGLDDVPQSCYFSGTFVDGGFYVFGSALIRDSSAAQGQPIAQTVLSSYFTTITYQQLKHPSIANDVGVTYDNSIHRMTSLIFADGFNGKTIVLAGFADGRKFLYYDGSLVQNSANGIVMTGRLTLADLGDDLLRQLEAFGWLGDANVDTDGSAQDGSVMVKSPASDYFVSSAVETSVSGFLGGLNFQVDQPNTPAVKAFASFRITANTGPFSITAPANVDGTGTVDLCGGSVSVAGSINLTAAAITSLINGLTSFHGYNSQTNGGDTVFVYAPLDFDVSPNPAIVLTVTPDASVTAGAGNPDDFSISVSPSVILGEATAVAPFAGLVVVKASAQVSINGPDTSYLYQWNYATANTTRKIKFGNVNTESTMVFQTLFDTGIGEGGTRTEQFICTVTQYGTSIAHTIGVTVSLKLNLL